MAILSVRYLNIFKDSVRSRPLEPLVHKYRESIVGESSLRYLVVVECD